MNTHIYISGNLEEGSRSSTIVAFSIASSHIRATGNIPITPYELEPNSLDILPSQYRAVNAALIKAVADAVYFMPGWEKSENCQADRRLAKELGLPIFDTISAIMDAED